MRRINDAQANPMPPSNQALRKAMERDEAAGTNVVVRDQRAAALVLTVATTDDPETIVREVSLLWNHAQQSFLAIGRYLLQGRRSIAKRLQHESPNMGEAERRSTVYGEYRRLILAKLPFGPKVANQLECVARAVYETERIRPDELPHNYSVAYQITTLSDQEIEAARAEGLMGPKAKRDLIIMLKRRRHAGHDARIAALRLRASRVSNRIDALRSELQSIEQELSIAATIDQSGYGQG